MFAWLASGLAFNPASPMTNTGTGTGAVRFLTAKTFLFLVLTQRFKDVYSKSNNDTYFMKTKKDDRILKQAKKLFAPLRVKSRHGMIAVELPSKEMPKGVPRTMKYGKEIHNQWNKKSVSSGACIVSGYIGRASAGKLTGCNTALTRGVTVIRLWMPGRGRKSASVIRVIRWFLKRASIIQCIQKKASVRKSKNESQKCPARVVCLLRRAFPCDAPRDKNGWFDVPGVRRAGEVFERIDGGGKGDGGYASLVRQSLPKRSEWAFADNGGRGAWVPPVND